MASVSRVLACAALLTIAGPAFAGATQSNFRKETRKGANYWSGMATHDMKDDTAWMVPGESENVDEWLMFDVPKVAVDAIGMNVGWAKNEETFKDYARVKKIRIEAFEYDDSMELVPAGKPVDIEFADEMGMQVVQLPETLKGDKGTNGKVKLIVKEVYEGRDFPSLAVSEALVFLNEFTVPYDVKAISHEDDKNTREALIDLNDKTVWVGPAEGASFTLSSPLCRACEHHPAARRSELRPPQEGRADRTGTQPRHRTRRRPTGAHVDPDRLRLHRRLLG